MYRNTMYIPTITSWLHSQWQSYIATNHVHSHNNILTTQSMAKLHRHKNRIVSSTLTTIQFSLQEHRTKIILSTEHQYKNYFVIPKQRKALKEKQTQKQFFTVTVRDKSRDNYWNSKQNNSIWFWTFLWELMLPKLQTLHCNGILILKQS